MPLNRQPAFQDPDAVYATIVAAHRDLSAEASAAFNARLVLILANHIGDAAVIHEALEVAATQGLLNAKRVG